MKRAKNIALAVLAALTVGLPLCARAEESGGGHYLPGAAASFIDALPGRPGLAVANYFTFYDGSAGRSRQLPFGGLLATGLDATIYADTVAAVYETPLRLLGGEYGVAVAVPYVWVEVKGTVTTGTATRTVRDTADGIGDLTLYEECIHLPLSITHPDVRGGQECRALTAHIDMAPTLLAMAGVRAVRIAELAGRNLPGKDLTPVLGNAGAAGVNAIREGVLFTYSGLVSVDSEPLGLVSKARAEGKDWQAILKSGVQPNFRKRGTVRSAFDGRYKFTRYFSPVQHHRPDTLDELYEHNDLELFDLQTDPGETTNLAAVKGQHRDLVLAMSAKLEALIKAEMRVDDGREMPEFRGVAWTIDTKDNETVLD